jgi:hypothetical protein
LLCGGFRAFSADAAAHGLVNLEQKIIHLHLLLILAFRTDFLLSIFLVFDLLTSSHHKQVLSAVFGKGIAFERRQFPWHTMHTTSISSISPAAEKGQVLILPPFWNALNILTC